MSPLTVTRAHVWCNSQIHYIWYCGWCRIVQGIKQPCGKWPTSASPPLRSGCFSIIIRLDFDWHDTFWSRIGDKTVADQGFCLTEAHECWKCFSFTHIHTQHSEGRLLSFPISRSFSLFPHSRHGELTPRSTVRGNKASKRTKKQAQEKGKESARKMRESQRDKESGCMYRD